MDFRECEFVKKLYLAENRFLEPLITKFDLVRTEGGGVELSVSFAENSFAIWNNLGRNQVRDRIPDFDGKSAYYRAELDEFLLEGKGDKYPFNDSEFPFRYASGGALPVLWMDGEEYYCLIYREVWPIGWNLANGGCDSKVELLKPLEAAERELREELMILDPDIKKKRYVFKADVGKSLERPEFAIARTFWEKRHPEWDLERLEEVEIPTKWLRGPDSVKVRLESGDRDFITSDCFLNINALDFGIEIDRVVRLTVDRDARLLDGEILSGWIQDGKPLPTTIVNAPIGLFNTEKLNAAFKAGSDDFRPDRLFWDGREWDPHRLEERIGVWVKEITPWLIGRGLERFRDCEAKFDLCPVTRSLITRCLTMWFPRELEEAPVAGETSLASTIGVPGAPDLPQVFVAGDAGSPSMAATKEIGLPEVFVCSASEDYDLAQAVNEFLEEKAAKTGKGLPFFCEHTRHDSDFGRAIEEALDSANCLVVVARDPSHVLKEYPSFEWRSFHVAMLNKRKTKSAQLLSYISGFDSRALPWTLSFKEAIVHDPINKGKSLEKLYKFVELSFR